MSSKPTFRRRCNRARSAALSSMLLLRAKCVSRCEAAEDVSLPRLRSVELEAGMKGSELTAPEYYNRWVGPLRRRRTYKATATVAIGSVKWKRVSLPGVLSAQIRPPWASTRPLLM